MKQFIEDVQMKIIRNNAKTVDKLNKYHEKIKDNNKLRVVDNFVTWLSKTIRNQSINMLISVCEN